MGTKRCFWPILHHFESAFSLQILHESWPNVEFWNFHINPEQKTNNVCFAVMMFCCHLSQLEKRVVEKYWKTTCYLISLPGVDPCVTFWGCTLEWENEAHLPTLNKNIDSIRVEISKSFKICYGETGIYFFTKIILNNVDV